MTSIICSTGIVDINCYYPKDYVNNVTNQVFLHFPSISHELTIISKYLIGFRSNKLVISLF